MTSSNDSMDVMEPTHSTTTTTESSMQRTGTMTTTEFSKAQLMSKHLKHSDWTHETSVQTAASTQASSTRGLDNQSEHSTLQTKIQWTMITMALPMKTPMALVPEVTTKTMTTTPVLTNSSGHATLTVTASKITSTQMTTTMALMTSLIPTLTTHQ